MKRANEWDPLSAEAREDPLGYFDWIRENRPVAYHEKLGWSLFRHADVLRAAGDHATFSNVVSQHVAIPNGQDPPEHTVYRRIIESYFGQAEMRAFEPLCREVIVSSFDAMRGRDEVELCAEFAQPCAARLQCAFMGWPPESERHLVDWAGRSQAATRVGDRPTLDRTAQKFADFVVSMLHTKRGAYERGLMTRLAQEEVHGRRLTESEIVAIVRNWTVGEIGTIAASFAIILHFFAVHPEAVGLLRKHSELVAGVSDEILRIHGPLPANRRVATRAVEIEGRQIDDGDRVSLIWIAANRDARAFADPTTFDPRRDQSMNLLYGTGVHACPGAPLARLELRVLVEEFLRRWFGVRLPPGKRPIPALYPAGGFENLSLRFDAG